MGYVILDKKQCEKYGKKRKRKFVACLILLFALLFVVCGCLYWSNLIKRFVGVACDEAESALTISVNNAIADVFASAKYNDFVKVIKDEQGTVSLVETNQTTVNLFTSRTAAEVQQIIATKNTFSLPIGSVCGFVLLSEKGPCVTADFRQIGKVICKLQSEFTSAGINQTLHRLYVVIDASLQVVVSSNKKTIQTQNTVLIFETVIVGQVPQVYIDKC